MTNPPDSPDLIYAAINEDFTARQAWLRRQAEPLDPDYVDLMVHELVTKLGQCDRIANLLINRPRGLPEEVIDSLQYIKVSLAHLRYHIDHRLDPAQTSELRNLAHMLAEFHMEDRDDIGVDARRILEILNGRPKAP